jgi:eukaryotic-like serine/threonine-protein kinase
VGTKLLAGIVLSLVAVGCGGNGSSSPPSGPATSVPSGVPTADFETYTDVAEGFTIAYPKHWEKREGALGSSVLILSPTEEPSDDFRENVNVLVQTVPEETSLGEYTRLSLDEAPKVIMGFDLLDDGPAMLSGAPAHQVHYRGEQGAFRLEWKQVYALKNGKAFILTYTAERDQYEAGLPTAEAMFASFRLP